MQYANQPSDFLDHLMRVTPTKTMYAIKRSFFHHDVVARESIGGGVEAMKGVYQSIRAAQGGRLIVNVDTSNSAFWGCWPMWVVGTQCAGVAKTLDLQFNTQKVRSAYNAPLKDSVTMIKLRKLKKVRFNVTYRGASEGKSSSASCRGIF